MARYSLLVKNKKDSSKSFIFKLPPLTKETHASTLSEKVDLIIIDYFTSEFEDKKALLSYILKTDDVDDYEVEITYRSNKKEKKLEVAYFDDVLIKNFSHIYTSSKTIPVNNSDFIHICDFLLKCCDNGIILRDAFDSSYINDYIREKINDIDYHRSKSYEDQKIRAFARENLLQELSKYKNIRGIMFLLKKLSQKYPELKIPVIIDKTNVTVKKYIKNDIPDIETLDIDEDTVTRHDEDKEYKYNPPFETEFVFNDPDSRNYDEPQDEEQGYEKPKTLVKKSNNGILPGQITIEDISFGSNGL